MKEKPIEQGGVTANYTGNRLESFIENTLKEKHYTFIHKDKFKPATQTLEQPLYTKQEYIGKSIYNTRMFCDFILFHPTKHPKCLIIESKWQQSKGTVDEKFPYFVLNIQQKYPHPTILLLDGSGYRKEAEHWVRSEVGKNLLHVFNMSSFQTWANKGNI